MTQLYPLPGRVLVELREKYDTIATTEQKYDTRTFGICVNLAYANDNKLSQKEIQKWYTSLVGKLVFWEEYKDGQVIERDGKKYAFIKVEDLDGYEDE